MRGAPRTVANNRMWMVCDACGERILLCKYYPTTRWYIYHESDKLDSWLESHQHGDDLAPYPSPGWHRTMWGPMHFRLEYEMAESESPLQE